MRILIVFAFLLGVALADDATSVERFKPHLLKPAEGEPKNGAVKVTFLGTSTLLFDDGETQILIDGFFTRPSLGKIAIGKIATDRKTVDTILKRVKADRVKAVFVVHSHYDHALDAAYVAKSLNAPLHGSASTLNIGRGGDVPEAQLVKFEPGKETKIGQFTVSVFESKHSPPMKGVNDDLGQTIDQPLKQPAAAKEYKEGGSFDILVRRGGNTLLVKPSCASVPGALDKVRANVLFLGTATLAEQKPEMREKLYAEIVGKLKPELVVPIHWDNFFVPLSETLKPLAPPLDDIPAGFDFLIGKLGQDKIRFGWLQGFQDTMLFDHGNK